MKKLLFTLIFVASFFVNVDGQNFEWGRGFTGMGSAYSTTLAVDNSGNVYSAGLLSGVVDFDPGIGLFNLIAVDTNDLFVSKLDSDGNFLWAKQIGGNVYNDGVTSVAIDLNGDVIITGWFQSTVDFDPSSTTYYLTSQGAYDIFILKLDSAGNFIWANKIGGNGDDNCNSIVVDDSNNLVITGFFAGVVDFNPGQGFFGLVSIGAQDIFVSKYTNSGSFIWAKAIGGSGGDVGLDLALSPLDDVYCTGHFSNAVDFDPNIGVSNLISNGLTDIFIFKLDSDGNFIWAKSFGGVNSDGGNSIAIDVSGDLVSTGWFQGIVDFDPSNNISSITPIGFKNASFQNLIRVAILNLQKHLMGQTILLDMA
nr:hypothetical protein [Bacteroidota bacterium]